MGFNKRTLTFFRQLARHNEKQWFEAHRGEYENDVRTPMRELIEELDVRFAQFAPEIVGDRKRSMFRINRDIRFSSDKSPYKTHAASWFYHGNAARAVGAEAEEGSAGFYFHLQPGQSQLGAGLWMPPRSQLNKLRASIVDDPEEFENIVKSIPRRFGGLGDEAMLKRMPRGFPEDHAAAKWLRYQSFTTGRELTDEDVTKDSLAALLAKEYKALLPFVRWLNGALGFKPASQR